MIYNRIVINKCSNFFSFKNSLLEKIIECSFLKKIKLFIIIQYISYFAHKYLMLLIVSRYQNKKYHIFELSLCYDTSTSMRTSLRQKCSSLSGRDCARWNSVLRKRRLLMKIDYPSGLVLTPTRVKSACTHTTSSR